MTEQNPPQSPTQNAGPGAVELSVRIDASAETVWAILSTPERFSTWMGGQITFETKAGSPYRAVFAQFEMVLAGKVLAFSDQERRFLMTWGIESGPQAERMPPMSSLVEFRVSEHSDGVHVHLRHSGFLDARTTQEHDAGWRFHLGRLALSANRTDLTAGLARTLPHWWAAWNETEENARLKVLEASCAPDLEFRDDWATVQSVERLSLHIANCQRFMPGWHIEPTGEIRICRGEALVGWRSRGQGDGVQEGLNHLHADHDGIIRRVTGFAASPSP